LAFNALEKPQRVDEGCSKESSMNWISQLLRRPQVDEKIRLDTEERAERFMHNEITDQAAAQTAQRAVGSEPLREQHGREVWQWPAMEFFRGDVRFAMRQLCKSPGFTITAVVTLALAIGANAVVFGVLNALILRPLKVPQAESLFVTQHGSDEWHSYPDYLDLRRRNRSFSDMAAWAISQAGLDTGKDPSNVWAYETSGNYFDVLRIEPYLGRFFHKFDEHGPNSAPFVVLS
jgi:hypothetical protein